MEKCKNLKTLKINQKRTPPHPLPRKNKKKHTLTKNAVTKRNRRCFNISLLIQEVMMSSAQSHSDWQQRPTTHLKKNEKKNAFQVIQVLKFNYLFIFRYNDPKKYNDICLQRILIINPSLHPFLEGWQFCVNVTFLGW